MIQKTKSETKGEALKGRGIARMSDELYANLIHIAKRSNRKISEEIRARLEHSLCNFETIIDQHRVIAFEGIELKVGEQKYLTSHKELRSTDNPNTEIGIGPVVAGSSPRKGR